MRAARIAAAARASPHPAASGRTGETPNARWTLEPRTAPGGWQQWEIDLGRYEDSQVEVSITALSDWGLQQFPGVFVDDITVSTGEGTTSFEDDADPTDGWTVPGAPQDDAGVEGPNRNDWTRRGGLGIKEGAVIATPDTLYMGFGFEGITDAATRDAVMGRALDQLLG